VDCILGIINALRRNKMRGIEKELEHEKEQYLARKELHDSGLARMNQVKIQCKEFAGDTPKNNTPILIGLIAFVFILMNAMIGAAWLYIESNQKPEYNPP